MNFLKIFFLTISLFCIIFIGCKDDTQTNTNSGNTPETPVLISPLNDSQNVPVILDLDWSDVNYATSYSLQISSDIQFSSILKDTSLYNSLYSTYFGLLDTLKYYYWRVKSTNQNGSSSWSYVWKFRTTFGIPSIPLLRNPANNEQNVAMITTFGWDNIVNSTNYRIQISTFDNFNSLIKDTIRFINTYTSYNNLLMYNTQYYWRVSALNQFGSSPWSSTSSFRTRQPPIYVNGNIRFVESNFTLSGTYLVTAYSSWPPMGGPNAFDTIHISPPNLSYNYSFADLPFGQYAIAVQWRKPTGGQSYLMGVYGCDTSHNITCWSDPIRVSVSGVTVNNINFLSWADTSKKIY